MSKFFTTLLWLCNQAMSGLSVGLLGNITLLLLVLLFLSVVLSIGRIREKWKPSFTGVLLQFLFFPLVAAVGVIWWNDSGAPPNRVPPSPVAEYLLWLLNIASAAVGGYFIYLMKGLRLFATSVFMMNLWLLIHINFVVGMALTSVWL